MFYCELGKDRNRNRTANLNRIGQQIYTDFTDWSEALKLFLWINLRNLRKSAKSADIFR